MTTKVTRVLHATLDSTFRGGAETYLRALMRESARNGVESRVFDLRPPGIAEPYDFNQIGSLLAIARSFDPHVIHCHLYWADLVGAMIAPLIDCPLISTKYSLAPVAATQAKSQPPSPNTRSVLDAFNAMPSELRLSKYADLVTTASEAVRDSYAALGVDDGKLTVIRTAHLTRSQILESMSQRSFQCHGEQGGGRILAVARLEPEKGVADLLRTVAICRRDRDLEIEECVILGDGSCRDELMQLAVELQLTDLVRFEGSRTQEECLGAMTRCDVVVIPSRSEGLSLVAQEAMAAGCPVVGTDCGGLHEVIGDPSALVRPGDAAGLATALGTALSRPRHERWVEADAHHRILATFTVEQSAAQTLDAYEAAYARTALRAGQRG